MFSFVNRAIRLLFLYKLNIFKGKIKLIINYLYRNEKLIKLYY